jgi:hypothetical protein
LKKSAIPPLSELIQKSAHEIKGYDYFSLKVTYKVFDSGHSGSVFSNACRISSMQKMQLRDVSASSHRILDPSNLAI